MMNRFKLCVTITYLLTSSYGLQAFNWQEVYHHINQGHLEEAFACSSGEGHVRIVLKQNGAGEFIDEQGQSSPLEHRLENQSLVVEVAAQEIKQQTFYVEGALGIISSMSFPSAYCYVISHNKGPQFQTDLWIDCGTDPGSYIPGVGYSSNMFILSQRTIWHDATSRVVPGGAFRKKNTETQNDTITSYSWGVYLIQDKNIFIYFGAPEERELFTGELTEDFSKVKIKELGHNEQDGQWCQITSDPSY